MRDAGQNAAFLSNAKRMLSTSVDGDNTPGPGNYAQYSSLKSPLIFPYGGTKESYIIYENGKMSRKVQSYAGKLPMPKILNPFTADKRRSERSITNKSYSPGPGEYDYESTSFKLSPKPKKHKKERLIICSINDPDW